MPKSLHQIHVTIIVWNESDKGQIISWVPYNFSKKAVGQLFEIEMFTLSQPDRYSYSLFTLASAKTNKQTNNQMKKNTHSENILPQVLPYQLSQAVLFVGTQPS